VIERKLRPMKNNYESPEVTVLGRAEDVILGNKQGGMDSDTDPFISVAVEEDE
jgi:hypothetical protein